MSAWHVDSWMGVNESLPDDDTTVLIALKDGEVWTGYHCDGAWCYVSGDKIEPMVTYWMDLPAHPGAEA